MKQKVIIIGNSFTSRLGVVRALANNGYEIVIIVVGFFNNLSKGVKPTKPIDGYSKFVDDILYFNRADGEEGLVKLLLEKCAVEGLKSIIVPTSDFAAIAVDNNSLREFFYVPNINNEQGAIARWMDKDRQKQLALQVGLDAAQAKIIECRDGKYKIPAGLEFPCFTKPLASIGAGKKCMGRCNDKNDLAKKLQKAEKYNIQKIFVEDYIDIEKEFAVVGVTDGEHVIIPGVIEFIRGSKCHFGVAMQGKILPTNGFEKLLETFELFMKQTHFVGLFDIDFFESKGRYYFGELNLRYGASCYAATCVGVNLPLLYVLMIQGKDVDGMRQTIDRESVFVNERICVDDWLAENISKKERDTMIKHSEICFVVDANDIGPSIALKKEMRQAKTKMIIKKVIRKIKK